MQAEKSARGLAVERDILGFMKKWGVLGALGRLVAWKFQEPSTSLGSSGSQGLGASEAGLLGLPSSSRAPEARRPACLCVRRIA